MSLILNFCLDVDEKFENNILLFGIKKHTNILHICLNIVKMYQIYRNHEDEKKI